MPIPHDVMRRKIKERLVGKEPREQVRILKAALGELPGYFQGPYGELRKWISEEIEKNSLRDKTRYADAFAVRKEGCCQVAVVGLPNAGKSSILKWLTGRQVVVGDYAFTTLKPVSSVYVLHGAQIQLVEVPGIIEGAGEGKGRGRALLSCVRNADAALLAAALEPGAGHGLSGLWSECREALAGKQTGIALTKCDLAGSVDEEAAIIQALERLGLDTCPRARISVVSGEGREELDEVIWRLAGVIRVYCKESAEPFVLPTGSTVRDLARAIHHDLEAKVDHARVMGPSARFAGQSVGPDHVLQDTDRVELRT